MTAHKTPTNPAPTKDTEPKGKLLTTGPGKPSTTIPSDDAIGSHKGSTNQATKRHDK